MKKEDKQFDEFLNKTFDQKQFEFKEQYWTKAQQMIDSSKYAGTNLILTIVVSSVAIIALSIGLIGRNNIQVSNTTIQQNEQLVAQTMAIQPVSMDQQTTSMEDKKGEENKAVGSNGNKDGKRLTKGLLASNRQRPDHNNPPHSPSNQVTSRKSALLIPQSKPSEQDIILIQQQQEIERISGKVFPLKPINYPLELNSTKEIVSLDPLPYSKLVSHNRHLLTADAGLILQHGVNFSGKMQYGYFVLPKVALTVGLGYSRINQSLPVRTYEEVDFSFGQTITNTSITTKRLDYMQIPIGLLLELNNHHWIQLGVQYGHLLQSTDYVQSNDAKTQNGMVNGYTDAINPIDWQIFAGYTYLFKNNMTVSGGYHFGLSDVSNNQQFKSNAMDRNNTLKLSVGYRIF